MGQEYITMSIVTTPQLNTASFDSIENYVKKQRSKIKEIIQTVALLALAVLAVALVTAVAYILSGLPLAIVVLPATTALIHFGYEIYRILKPKQVKKDWDLARLFDRVERANKKPLVESLPKLCPIKDYTPPFPLDYQIMEFVDCETAKHMRQISVEASKNQSSTFEASQFRREASKRVAFLINSLSFSQVFLTLQVFMQLPAHKLHDLDYQVNLPLQINKYSYSPFFRSKDQARELLTKLIQRVEWIANIFKKEKVQFDSISAIDFLGTDIDLMYQTNALAMECDKVHSLISSNPNRVSEFKKYLNKGSHPFPHSRALYKQINKSGFSLSQQLYSLDSCKCKECEAIARTWHVWDKPELRHKSTCSFGAE